MTLNKLNNKIINCRQCVRLVNFREKIAAEKRRQYIDEKYWGKPITGYGDLYAHLLMIGLAPAAHGGNRTGRVFTGDKSADFLFKCLYKAGFSNQRISISKNDGLKLYRLLSSIILIFIVNFFLGFKTNDPMSGFFIFKKKIFLNTKKNLSNRGYKILLDLIYSYKKNLKIKDVFIKFKSREKGFSKMDLKIIYLLVFDIFKKFLFKKS